MERELIVSMTTWPVRVAGCVRSLESLVSQVKQLPAWCKGLVRVVLTISEDEFPEGLPEEVAGYCERSGVEVLVDAGNIRSHKKVVPVMERWPEADVLVVDDDRIYNELFVLSFLNGRSRWPGEVLYGGSFSKVYLDEDGRVCEKRYGRNLNRLGQVMPGCKPASGGCGTLYPAGVFERQEFFDREAFMRLSPSSDETWAYAWLVIGGKTLRCAPIFEPARGSGNTQGALFVENRERYSEIHEAIAGAYPEYREALERLLYEEV